MMNNLLHNGDIGNAFVVMAGSMILGLALIGFTVILTQWRDRRELQPARLPNADQYTLSEFIEQCVNGFRFLKKSRNYNLLAKAEARNCVSLPQQTIYLERLAARELVEIRTILRTAKKEDVWRSLFTNITTQGLALKERWRLFLQFQETLNSSADVKRKLIDDGFNWILEIDRLHSEVQLKPTAEQLALLFGTTPADYPLPSDAQDLVAAIATAVSEAQAILSAKGQTLTDDRSYILKTAGAYVARTVSAYAAVCDAFPVEGAAELGRQLTLILSAVTAIGRNEEPSLAALTMNGDFLHQRLVAPLGIDDGLLGST